RQCAIAGLQRPTRLATPGALTMVAFGSASRALRASTIALVLFVLVAAGEAAATTKIKIQQPMAPNASLLSHLGATSRVRVFTINQVLAKLDRGGRPESLRLAAVGSSGTLTDAPRASIAIEPS